MIERDGHATQVISEDSNSTKKTVNVLTEGKHASRSIPALSRCSHTSIRHMDLPLVIASRPTGALWSRRILWIREARLKMLIDVHDRLSSLLAELLTPVGTAVVQLSWPL
jgi:broad specificity phosphatase PhoE